MQTPWYRQTAEDVLSAQQVDGAKGLSEAEAAQRREKHGENVLKQGKKRTVVLMLLDQFKDFMVIVLIVASVLSALLGEVTDAIIILVVVVLNAILGVIQENRAEKSLEALKRMASPHAKALRDGAIKQVEAAALVPGDVIELEAGDCVPADIRLIEVHSLQVQESALTGESQPVDKRADTIEAECSVGDRINMAFSSSMVTNGRALGVVVETGMNTEIGHIAGMMQQEEGVKTPLQHRLDAMSKTLGWVCLGISAVVLLVGILYRHGFVEMFMRAVSLAVAAIPEGLPATVTIVLAIGVQRMSRKKAIIRRLPAVETLGSATVICSDKTGTLTLNRMTVVQVAAPFEAVSAEQATRQPSCVLLTTAAVLCNDAKAFEENGVSRWLGDPTETALLDFGQAIGYERPRLETRMPRVDEAPFDSDRKRMTTVHRENGQLRSYTKGAVDEMLPRCRYIAEGDARRPITDEDRERILKTSGDMAEDALRVLAFATADVEVLADADKIEGYEHDLVFLGLMGMIDPARPEVMGAVATCRRAGIKPVMITGDHKTTASAIARELGILSEGDRVMTGSELSQIDDDELRNIVRDVSVYARVSPEHKLRIVRAWQSWGDVVAMTGDGVNDAPALKRADIGVAMGITGTEVTKEASAMILADDNFTTIVSAVEEGRTIYANILKAIQLLLGCNIGEVLVVFIATMLNWATPLLPIHLLWVNLITDSLPALALGMEAAQSDTMSRPPQDPKAPLFSKPLVSRLIYQGLMVAILTLTAFAIGSKVSVATAQTMSFSVLAFSQLVQAFNVRSNSLSLFKLGVTSNKWLTLTFLLTVALQLLLLFVPPVRALFSLAPLSLGLWGAVIGLSLAPLAVVELMKALGWNGERLQK